MRNGPIVFIAWAALGCVMACFLLSCAKQPVTAGDFRYTREDGIAFRMMDRLNKEVEKSLYYNGFIARTAYLENGANGIPVLCSSGFDLPDIPPSARTMEELDEVYNHWPHYYGDLAVYDTSLWKNLLFRHKHIRYVNREGAEADGKTYTLYVGAGPSSLIFEMGTLLAVSGQRAASEDLVVGEWNSPYLAFRRKGQIYDGPLGSGWVGPSARRGFVDPTPEMMKLKNAQYLDFPHGPDHYQPNLLLRENAKQNKLTKSIALIGYGFRGEVLLVVMDLRELEKEKGTYLWSGQTPQGYAIYLDECVVTLEDQTSMNDDDFKLTVVVEYPYALIKTTGAHLKAYAPNSAETTTEMVIQECKKAD